MTSLDEQLSRAVAVFAPNTAIVAHGDEWIDPLGVRTSCSFRSKWRDRAGQTIVDVQDEKLEWLALLDALDAATSRFCIVELGAGFGPWLARGGVAWKRVHPALPYLLIGIEGEPEHYRMLVQHLTANAIPSERVLLVEGAVATHDGDALFEEAVNATNDWGTRIADGLAPRGLPRVIGARERRVRAVSLATLTQTVDSIDLLHVDIQGSEVPVLTAAESVLRTKVRRMLVGTHGRDIEAQLMEWLPGLGFRLTAEQACRYDCSTPEPTLLVDGAQYWING